VAKEHSLLDDKEHSLLDDKEHSLLDDKEHSLLVLSIGLSDCSVDDFTVMLHVFLCVCGGLMLPLASI
jgi:hypothetical protein